MRFSGKARSTAAPESSANLVDPLQTWKSPFNQTERALFFECMQRC